MSFIDSAVSLIGDAAAPYVLIAQAGTSIGGIIPDVTIQEVISDENTITVHPVQSGAPVSDHVFANPVVADLAIAFSDSGFAGYPGRSQDLYGVIRALRDTRQPFDVYTSKRMLSSMLFGNISSQTDETNGSALFLRVRLQEVIISNTATAGGGVTADNQANPQQTAPETNVGAQTTLPYFASGQVPSGFTGISTGTGVGSSGIGGTAFTLTGPAA